MRKEGQPYKMEKKKVAIVVGSKSDIGIAEKAETVLREFEIEFQTHVISAHRNPNKIRKFASDVDRNGIAVIIAIAGLSAHLPGVLASLTTVPVIGVPVGCGPLKGEDALYSIVQMPYGIPVASVGIDNAGNAALFAAEILSINTPALRDKMKMYRKQFGDDD
jgi:5-(carboxyamino)imidazole ribonucleotide mutase